MTILTLMIVESIDQELRTDAGILANQILHYTFF